MGWFLFNSDNKTECEHDYEVIHNADFYNEGLYSSARNSLWECFGELKINFQDEFLKILKEKGVSEEAVIKLIRNELEPSYKKRLEEELEKRKAIGHVVVQRCKKCGHIYKEVINYCNR